ncbi:MAG: hypothetical protein ACQETL_20180 [Bacteroidota bacterium]
MKKIFYTILTVVLSLQLSFLLHALIEWVYIKMVLARGGVLLNKGFLGEFYCVLPWWVSYGLIVLALIGGYFLAQVWWRIVYVEKRHWKNKTDSK